MTVTSRAAGCPLLQVGRNTSAGWLLVPEIRAGASLRGARAADWAVEKRVPLMALCL